MVEDGDQPLDDHNMPGREQQRHASHHPPARPSVLGPLQLFSGHGPTTGRTTTTTTRELHFTPSHAPHPVVSPPPAAAPGPSAWPHQLQQQGGSSSTSGGWTRGGMRGVADGGVGGPDPEPVARGRYVRYPHPSYYHHHHQHQQPLGQAGREQQHHALYYHPSSQPAGEDWSASSSSSLPYRRDPRSRLGQTTATWQQQQPPPRQPGLGLGFGRAAVGLLHGLHEEHPPASLGGGTDVVAAYVVRSCMGRSLDSSGVPLPPGDDEDQLAEAARLFEEQQDGMTAVFRDSVFVRPHPDLYRVRMEPAMGGSTDVVAACMARDALGREIGDRVIQVGSGVLPGRGLLTVKDGDAVLPDAALFASAEVALWAIRMRSKTLREFLRLPDGPPAVDLCHPARDTHLTICPGTASRTGPSASAAVAGSFMSLLTGLRTRKDVGVMGTVHLSGELGPVGGVEVKAQAMHTGGCTGVALPPACCALQHEEEEQTLLLLHGLEVHRVRDVFELAQTLLLPPPGMGQWQPDESWRGRLDDGCYLGYASGGTYLWDGVRLTVHRLRIECAVMPAAQGAGGITVSGSVSAHIRGWCHAALAWLQTYGARGLEGALRPWVSSSSYRVHFGFFPLEVALTGPHLGPTVYMAMVAAATGWTQSPQVALFGAVSLDAQVLVMTMRPTMFDGLLLRYMAEMAGDRHISTWVVPEGSEAFFQGAYEAVCPDENTRPALSFVGVTSLWQALPIVFPDDYSRWQERVSQGKQAEK